MVESCIFIIFIFFLINHGILQQSAGLCVSVCVNTNQVFIILQGNTVKTNGLLSLWGHIISLHTAPLAVWRWHHRDIMDATLEGFILWRSGLRGLQRFKVDWRGLFSWMEVSCLINRMIKTGWVWACTGFTAWLWSVYRWRDKAETWKQNHRQSVIMTDLLRGCFGTKGSNRFLLECYTDGV